MELVRCVSRKTLPRYVARPYAVARLGLVIAISAVTFAGCEKAPTNDPAERSEWFWHQPNGDKKGLAIILYTVDGELKAAEYAFVVPEAIDDPLSNILERTPVKIVASNGRSFEGTFTDPETKDVMSIDVVEGERESADAFAATVRFEWGKEKSVEIPIKFKRREAASKP